MQESLMSARKLIIAVLIGCWSLARAQDTPSQLMFIWDFAPQRYDMEIHDSFGNRFSRGGEFDDNNHGSLRYVLDLMPGARSGMFSGGEIAYAEYESDRLEFKTFAISGIFGGYVEPSDNFRASLFARIGIGFDEADISISVFEQSDIASGVLSYGLTGLQYAIGLEGDLVLGSNVVLSVMTGFQGEWASAVSWMYYYDYPESYIEVSTYGAILAAGIGARF
jgi:hypothetical protein